MLVAPLPTTTPRRLLVLYAGGTIGMVPGQHGYEPGQALPSYVESLSAQQAELRPHTWHVESMSPLLDSANAQPQDWYALARKLWQWQDRIDGVVVLHGTDTLAYAASFLSFLMQGFGRPIVITASQHPLGTENSDAPANLLAALRCALSDDLHEVALCFGGQLLRGNRVVKISASPEEGFVSPHWPALGNVQGTPKLDQAALLAAQASAQPPHLRDEAQIGLLRLYPGIPATLVQAIGVAHPQGLVLEMYGVGAGPAINTELCAALARLGAQGTPIVAVSQCPYAAIEDLGVYASGAPFARSGVIAGRDLSAAAAFAKLHYLAGHVRPSGLAAWEQAIHTPLAGEIRP